MSIRNFVLSRIIITAIGCPFDWGLIHLFFKLFGAFALMKQRLIFFLDSALMLGFLFGVFGYLLVDFVLSVSYNLLSHTFNNHARNKYNRRHQNINGKHFALQSLYPNIPANGRNSQSKFCGGLPPTKNENSPTICHSHIVLSFRYRLQKNFTWVYELP